MLGDESGKRCMKLMSSGRASLASVLCALFLASCSTTSDPVTQFGLTPTDLQASAGEDGFEASDSDLIAAAPGEENAAEGTSVPLPAARPGSETAAAPTPEPQTQTAQTNEQPPAGETAPVETAAQQAAEITTQTAAAEVPQSAARPAESETAEAEAVAAAEAETAAKKQTFLAAFFSAREPKAAQAAERAARPLIDPKKMQKKAEEKPKVVLAATSESRPVTASLGTGAALPGVRQGDSLFEFSSKSGADDDADADIYEEEPAYQVASAAGMARLAPNGLLKQRESVDTACLKPALVGMLKAIERHYGKRIVVTSGYRSPNYNRRVRGARKSLHMYCAAADIQISGVSKWELAKFVRSMPGRGGVGTYCHTKSVHVDVGPERDWNWRCRRRK